MLQNFTKKLKRKTYAKMSGTEHNKKIVATEFLCVFKT